MSYSLPLHFSKNPSTNQPIPESLTALGISASLRQLINPSTHQPNTLFPNTKPPKYIPQQFIVGDFAGYGAQAVECGAQVGG